MTDIQPVIDFLHRIDYQLRQSGDLTDIAEPAPGDLKDPLSRRNKPLVAFMVDHDLIHRIIDHHPLDPDPAAQHDGYSVVGTHPDLSVLCTADIIDALQGPGGQDSPP